MEEQDEEQRQTAIAKRGASLPEKMQPRNLAELKTIAVNVASSNLYGFRDPESAFVVMLTGIELGITPMQALRGIHEIKGKPTLSADMMIALVRRSDACEYFELESLDASQCTYVTKRVDGRREVSRSFTRQEAIAAEKWGSGTWKKHPLDMLRARAASKLARQEYPEVLLGMYTADELQDEPQHVAAEIVDAEPAEPEPTPQTKPDEPSDAIDVEAEPAEPSESWKRANRYLRKVIADHVVGDERRTQFHDAVKAMLGVESTKTAAPEALRTIADRLAGAESPNDAATAMIALWIHEDGQPRTRDEVDELRKRDAEDKGEEE